MMEFVYTVFALLQFFLIGVIVSDVYYSDRGGRILLLFSILCIIQGFPGTAYSTTSDGGPHLLCASGIFLILFLIRLFDSSRRE